MKSSAITKVAFDVLSPYVLVGLLVLAYQYFQSQGLLLYAGGLVLLWVFIWNATPHYLLWKQKNIPTNIKRQASMSFLRSSMRGAVVMPFAFSAFFVVPIILLFTKESANKLPGIFDTLYGDVNGIHGDSVFYVWNDALGEEIRIDLPQTADISEEQKQLFIGVNYFLPGVWQRTWASRVVWLLRNRSTKLSERMGVAITDYNAWKYWGQLTPIDHLAKGTYVLQMGSHFEIYNLNPLGKFFGKWPLICRQRFGFKLGNQMGPFTTSNPLGRKKRSEVINIAFTIRGDSGPQDLPFKIVPLVSNDDGSVSPVTQATA